jgi:hypothetical protein
LGSTSATYFLNDLGKVTLSEPHFPHVEDYEKKEHLSFKVVVESKCKNVDKELYTVPGTL